MKCQPWNEHARMTFRGNTRQYKLGSKDVVFAKSLIAQCHPGCKRFDRILQSFHQEYSACKRRTQKQKLVYEVIATVKRYGGRFVRFHADLGVWEELPMQVQQKKVSQALREAHDRARNKAHSVVSCFMGTDEVDCSLASKQDATAAASRPMTSSQS